VIAGKRRGALSFHNVVPKPKRRMMPPVYGGC
jgi:hypothetical protein